MRRFNFQRGKATKKGKIETHRILTKDHLLYLIYFNSSGRRRNRKIVENNRMLLSKCKNIREVRDLISKIKKEDMDRMVREHYIKRLSSPYKS